MPGIADLPLHRGRVPQWMLNIMRKLAEAIIKYMVEVRGPSSVIAMLSDPLWFQAFNNVIGMDWDSSGSTTVVTGILKSITWRDPQLGILILGGKGSHMKNLPLEAEKTAEIYGLDPLTLQRASRIAARIDSAFLQDGYQLYIHVLAVSSEGDYIVVQQGMNTSIGMARRYHVRKFDLEEPHSGVAGKPTGVVLNATASESRGARKLYLDLLQEGSKRIVNDLLEANRRIQGTPTILDFMDSSSASTSKPGLKPYYKPVIPTPNLIRAIERITMTPPNDESDLVLLPGLGPKIVRALALIADIIYGVPTSIRDPVSHPLDPFLYSYAVGGKDGVPYRFDPKTAIEAYRFLEEALEAARINVESRNRALHRLRRLIRSLEQYE